MGFKASYLITMNVQWALYSSVSNKKPQEMDWFTELLNLQPTKDNFIQKFLIKNNTFLQTQCD